MNKIKAIRNQIIGVLLSSSMIFAAEARAAENGKIAFTSDRDGNPEIYVMDTDGTNQVRITDNVMVDDHPAWSPDGRKIAFVSQRPSGAYAIFVVNADGTDKTEITPITLPNFVNKILSWSPDGRQIAFSDLNGIYVVDADGSHKRFLTAGFEPAWSPDGSKILFLSRNSGFYANTLNTISPDGTNLRLVLADLPQGYGIVGYPDWSPDGGRIGFLAFDGANEGIFIANSNGTDARGFAFDCGGPSPQGCSGINSVAWSPDGTEIAYAAYGNIYVINEAGYWRRVLATTGNNSSPSWQPLLPAPLVAVNGRIVTPDGRGLRNATVSITDSNGTSRATTTSSFGLFLFDAVVTGAQYTISVRSHLFRFMPQTVSVNGDLTLADFVGLE